MNIPELAADQNGRLFCSTIIPTIGRPSLNRSVESVLNQQCGDTLGFEVIVVNDSGTELPYADWQASERVTIVETFRRERSVARNIGAALAQGKYLHFLDDDDWLAPNALLEFARLASETEAAWLYGVCQIVDRQHVPLVQLRQGLRGNALLPTMAGEWIPLQASLIRAERFFEIGGFNPLLTGPEDIDLLRRMALRSDLADTTAVVANVVMGTTGSTTDYDTHHLGSRWAREKILNEPAVFARLRAGARNSFWHGRLLRIYLTSIVWNLQHRRLCTAMSRLQYGLAALLSAGLSLFSPKFWSAVASPYRSASFSAATEGEVKQVHLATTQESS